MDNQELFFSIHHRRCLHHMGSSCWPRVLLSSFNPLSLLHSINQWRKSI